MTDNLAFLLTAWATFFIAAISPGPNMLAVMERAFGGGRKSAIGVAIGIAIGSFAWSVSTTSVVRYIAQNVPFLIPLIGFTGGLYLIRIGVLKLMSIRGKRGDDDVVPVFNTDISGDIYHGFTVIITNPKVAMFWISLSALISSTEIGQFHILMFSLACAMTALAIYTSEAIIFSNDKVRLVYLNGHIMFGYAFVAIFISVGCYLIWVGIRHI